LPRWRHNPAKLPADPAQNAVIAPAAASTTKTGAEAKAALLAALDAEAVQEEKG
jgi:hypothetical protein